MVKDEFDEFDSMLGDEEELTEDEILDEYEKSKD